MIGRTLVRWGTAALCCAGALMGASSALAQAPTTGACCAVGPNGGTLCSVMSEADCAAAQGRYLGAGTSCTSSTCLVTTPSGACCLTASTAPFVPCLVTTEAQCAASAGGVWHGSGSTCGSATPSAICNPAPTGACCFQGNTAGTQCQAKTQADCAAVNGHWLGAGVACTTTSCSPVGACCIDPGVLAIVPCQIVTETQCNAFTPHVWHGAGSTCTANLCPIPTGACCLANPTAGTASCIITPASQCNGTWKGAGTTCGNDTCPQPVVTGACCVSGFAGWMCIIATPLDCSHATGGVYKGNNTVCTTALCTPVTTGACCTSNSASGTTVCTITIEAQCTGTWRGAGTTCGNDTCPQPVITGACCITAAGAITCTITTQAACQGTWRGANTTCTSASCTPPTGGCCLLTPNGPVCSITIQAQCNGTWRGAGTTCAGDFCQAPTGACCLANSPAGAVVCTITTLTQCNGTWRGPGTTCGTDTCPQPTPTGACCSIASSTAATCTITTQANCQGTWKGANTVCGNDICVPRAACCYTSAGTTAVVCAVLTQANCTAHQGTWSASAASCVPFPCTQPMRGACCLPLSANATTSICIVTTPADCTARQGTYKGDNSVCMSTTCPQPTPRGACCTTSTAGTPACSVLTQADCTAAGGTYRGNGAACSNDICVPRGACCNPAIVTGANVNCVITTQAACANLQGTWQSGVTCDAANCPAPPAHGACCVSSANGLLCSVRTQVQCTAAGGVYRGDNVPCTASTCPRPCVCDWDHSGAINAIDLHNYLTDFLAGNADITGDGQTNLQDLNAFLDCYQRPPASCAPGGGPILIGGDGAAPTGSTGAGRD